MLASVSRLAIADANGSGLAESIDAIAVVRLFQDSGFGAPFGTSNNFPAGLAQRIGANPRRHIYSPEGGEVPQHLVNLFSEEIAAGRHDVVLLAGCEPMRTQARAQRAGLVLDWSEEFPNTAEALVGLRPSPSATMLSAQGAHESEGKRRAVSKHEIAHGIALPSHVYPLFENALAHHYGVTPAQHLANIGELMTRFAKIAEQNPYSQIPIARSAAEIISVSDENRMIAYPYTKYLNSNMFVDQAAAVLLMSTEAANRAQIPVEKRVYLHGSADIHERLLVSDRMNYHSSPAIRIGAARALAAAGITVSDLHHIDLYSCFPAAVEISADEIGLAHDDPRGLTLTGGLPYFGGPGNNYAMHGIAEVVARCRANPGSWGFNFANGMYLTKHSFGVWNTISKPFSRQDPRSYQVEIDAMVTPELVERPDGLGLIETFTVVFHAGVPMFAIVIGRLVSDNRRFLAQIHEKPEALVDAPMIGRHIRVRSTDTVNIAELI